MPSPPRPTPGPGPVIPEPRPSSVAPRPPPNEAKDTSRDRRPPQDIIDEFWKVFSVEKPSKATTIIPQNEYAEKAATSSPAPERTTRSSYAEAAAICRTKVRKIANECRAINRKYRDPHFDLEADLKLNLRDCLESLSNRAGSGGGGDDDEPDAQPPPLKPMDVKRVADIFDEPRFYVDGPSTNDVRQGKGGDCWLLAALCTLSNKEGLIDRICVERDEQVGVYGFVFHRDGEWFSEIIDDKLYLKRPDYDESFIERMIWEDRDRVDSEEAYRRIYQTNSGALYFSQCEHPNETWLPLLEKAYAKAHGDYTAIEGGFTGEGIEDLTGGVTTEIYTSDVLDREAFWRDELMQVNKEFLFGCSTGIWGRGRESQKGILSLHAYSVMRAVEAEGQRLVLLKNPWGKGEWKGPWSDGSKEWTAEWLRRLDHKFGDDGAFWISYADLLRKYQSFDRTRLFGGDWRVASAWTTLAIPWKYDYHDTHFAFTLASAGEVVIVLSQLDDRYFRGLEGQYEFSLAFRLHRSGQEDYIVRTPPAYRMRRSVNVEVKLEAGDYTVMVKVDATREDKVLPVEEVIRQNAKERREKLLRIGLAYDLAHSKGRYVESEEEERARVAHEEREERRDRKEAKEEIMKRKTYARYSNMRRELTLQKDHIRAQRVQEHVNRGRLRTGDQGPSSPGRKRYRSPAGRHHPESSQRKESSPSQKAMDNQNAAKRSDPPTGPPSQSTPQTDIPEPSEPGAKHKNDPAPTKTEEPSEKRTPEAGTEKTGERGQERKPSSGEEAQRHLGETETESFKTARAASLPIVFEEPQNYCESESESGSESVTSDLTLSTVSEPAEREVDYRLEDQAMGPPGPGPEPPLPPMGPPPGPAAGPAPETNPWNAVVVAGLRIYHKIPEESPDEEVVKVRVVRPISFSDDDESEGEEEKEEKKKEAKGSRRLASEASKGLDVDDSAKDATLGGTEKERKLSIDPKQAKEDNRGRRRSRMVCGRGRQE